MSLVHNEQTNLTATWLNALATIVTGAGAIAPMAATFYGMGTAQPVGPTLIIGFAVWVGIGVGLDLVARLSLRRLRP